MKKVNLTPEILFLCFCILVGISSCKKEDSLTSCTYPNNNRVATICGTPVSADLVKQNQTNVLGSIEVSNDASNVFVTITAPGGINAIKLYYGPCAGKPTNPAHYGNEVILTGQTSYTYTIARSSVDSCACYAARVETNGVGLATTQYCQQVCPEACTIQSGDFKTYGQGAYGATPHGNNPATYLVNTFDQAFPTGITIGCTHTLSFTSAQAVMDFLPQGSTPAALGTSAVDHVGRITVLAGQVLTLALNIGFDDYDASFSSGNKSLKDLVVASGDFQGMSVAQIMGIANDVLGGCSSSYSPSQMNDIVTAINENFEDGNVDNGVLTCANAN